MDNPLVSVVIAVRNGERFLTAAINSVLNQSYRPIEIVVVDGHSTDCTAEIAKSFPEVRYVLQQQSGVPDAYNVGIADARGDFIAFLSSDDLWTPDKLSSQIGYLLENPGVQYSTARVKFFLEPGYSEPEGFRPELFEGDHVGHIMETLVARRSAFDLVGTFDLELRTAHDVDWFSRANDRNVPAVVIERVLLHKRVHDENISVNSRANTHELLQAIRGSINRKRSAQ